jgi:hypothetical protein
MQNNIITVLIILFFCQYATAQFNCGSDVIMQQMMQDSAFRNSKNSLENSILLQNKLSANQRIIDPNELLTLPVVVHILHKGEALGTGTNITDAQVIAAINDVNSRYSFLSGTGSIDTKIQFCLAKRSPSGGTTNGIDRIDASTLPNYAQYGLYLGKTVGPHGPRDTALCKLANWPHEDYINIWVVTKIDTIAAAFAYFPSTAGYNFPQDGLWVEYDYMLNQTSYPVVAHELGHFLNLAHTFAGSESGNCPVDTNCNVDGDKVCDTPPHKQSECSSSCAGSFPNLANSINNYMSYCGTAINRFTAGQKNRMRISLGNSNRTPLLVSGACNTPITLDISAKTIFLNADSFLASTCNSFFRVKNSGTQTINNFKYYIKLYGASAAVDSFSWSGALAPNDTLSVPISFYKLPSGINKVKVYVSKPNAISGSDLIPTNDSLYEVIKKINKVKNACTSFDSIDPFNWKQEVAKYTYYNGQYGWTGTTVSDLLRTVPCQGKVMVLNNFGGSYYIDVAVKSPVLDLTKAKNPVLTFKYSFKSSGKGGNDVYKATLWVVDTCDETNMVFFDSKDLSPNITGVQSSSPWIPSTCNHWKEEEFDLCNFVGSSVRLQFDVWNYQDSLLQNFYFDDICVSERTMPYAGKDTVSCTNTLNLNANTSANSYWSILSGTGGQVSNSSNATSGFTGENATDYLLSWNTPYSCNTVSDTVLVKLKKPITPNFISPPKICLKDTLHLSAIYVSKSVAHWYHQSLFSQQGFEVTRYPLTFIDSGQYNLYFTDSIFGCKSDTVKVNVNLTDTFQSNRISTVCLGDTFNFYGQKLYSPGLLHKQFHPSQHLQYLLHTLHLHHKGKGS